MRLSALLSRGSLIGTDWQEHDFLVGVAFCICPSLCTGETPWKSSWAQSLLLERSCPLQAMQGLGACGRGVWLTSEREGKAHGSCRREQKRKKNNCGERCEREQSAGKYSKTTSGQRRHRVLKSGCLSGRVLHTCMAPAARASFPRHKYWSHKTCEQHCILCMSPTSTFCPWEPSTMTAGCEVPATGMPWCFSLFRARAAQMIVSFLPCNLCHQPVDEPLVMPWG